MLLAVLTSQFLSVSSSRDSSMWLAGSVALGLEVRLDYTFCCSRAKLLISRWPGSKRGEKGYGDKTCSSKTPRELCPSLQLASISTLSYQQINLVFKSALSWSGHISIAPLAADQTSNIWYFGGYFVSKLWEASFRTTILYNLRSPYCYCCLINRRNLRALQGLSHLTCYGVVIFWKWSCPGVLILLAWPSAVIPGFTGRHLNCWWAFSIPRVKGWWKEATAVKLWVILQL